LIKHFWWNRYIHSYTERITRAVRKTNRFTFTNTRNRQLQLDGVGSVYATSEIVTIRRTTIVGSIWFSRGTKVKGNVPASSVPVQYILFVGRSNAITASEGRVVVHIARLYIVLYYIRRSNDRRVCSIAFCITRGSRSDERRAGLIDVRWNVCDTRFSGVAGEHDGAVICYVIYAYAV